MPPPHRSDSRDDDIEAGKCQKSFLPTRLRILGMMPIILPKKVSTPPTANFDDLSFASAQAPSIEQHGIDMEPSHNDENSHAKNQSNHDCWK
jgi:hypothetical protein